MKVLIVDDEIPIREWIAYSIAKNKNCSIVGTAKNGQEALEIFMRYKPELVITDIKMPVMDGIELLDKMKESNHKYYSVVLTSHSDFEFARKALQLNAEEYILKTEMDDEVLKGIIKRYESYLVEDRADMMTTLLKKSMGFSSIVDNKDGTDTISKYFKKVSITIKDEPLIVAIIPINQANVDIQLQQLDDIDRTYIDEFESVILHKEYLCILINLIKNPSQLFLLNAVYTIAKSLEKIFEDQIVSVSSIGRGFRDFHQIIAEAFNGVNLRFYNENGFVLACDSYLEMENKKQKQKEMFNLVIKTIESNNKDSMIEALDNLISNVRKDKLKDIEFVKEGFLAIINKLVYRHQSDNLNYVERIRATHKKIMEVNTMEELADYVYCEIEEESLLMDMSYSTYTKKAIAYTTDNYKSINSISELADYLGLNSDYFCRLFKAEYGLTYISYLNSVKLGHAVELLKETDFRIYEIAELVGYKNMSYFSRCFKKKFHMSPQQYKTSVLK